MSAHTPGPWTAHQYGVRDSGGYICALKWPSLYTGQDERYWRETAERQADARLIAAAPDLLQVARLTMTSVDDEFRLSGEPDDYIRDTIGSSLAAAYFSAREAIAKATQP